MTSTRTIYVLAGAAPVVVHNGNCFGGKWSDDNNLDEHFRKHGEEMGFDTMTECNCAAQDLMCMCDGRRPGVLVKRDGDVQRFFDPESENLGLLGREASSRTSSQMTAWTISGGSRGSRFHK